ncbi:MAG: molybdenum cofactor guanylyltransferase [Calditrichae bacterium]|nr:molybdenum cofactor guanylyltransferase [Calditrichota bacterium]MCB9057493.1 molybdenum cofactor guanylyltransferase [Calditrichia bacterium]
MLKNVTAVLVAGGQSKRFGSSKIIAEYKGRRLIDYAIDVLKHISDDCFIVANFDKSEIDTSIPVFKDIISGCGPLCGIHAALNYADKKYVAVLPVDMPELAFDVYRFLYPSVSDDHPAVAVSHKGLEPLVSIWPTAQLNNFEKAISENEYKLHKILKQLNAHEIELSQIMPSYQEKWFENINYKKDLSLLENRTQIKINSKQSAH